MNEWISVEDRLPPDNTNFWFLDAYGGQGNAFRKNKIYWLETFNLIHVQLPDPITHWMPLPEPPYVSQ